MIDNIDLVINGMGGQGIVLCGEIIAKAVHKYNPKAFVVQNQNYSAQARGGFSQSTVKFSYLPILYPLVDIGDIVIYTGEEGFRIKSKVSKKGIIIAEEGLDVEKYFPHNLIHYLPLSRTIQSVGKMSQMNLLLLGLLQNYLKDYISYIDLKEEICNYFKGGNLEENIKLLELGRNLLTG